MAHRRVVKSATESDEDEEEDNEEEDEEDEIPVCVKCHTRIEDEEPYIEITIKRGNANKKDEWLEEDLETLDVYHIECYEQDQGWKSAIDDGLNFLRDVLQGARTDQSTPFEQSEIDRSVPTEMSRGEALKVLRLGSNPTEEEIKNQYKRLMMLYHPDRNPGNAEASKRATEINLAYEVLTKGGK